MQKSLKNLFQLFRRTSSFPLFRSTFKRPLFHFSSSNTPSNVPEGPPPLEAAKKALQDAQKPLEEQTFTLDNKTFTAKIGENTLTYTLEDEIKGAQYGVGGFYVIMFTCEVCESKSVKSFSKQSYHEGVVLIRCEGCDKIHLISDNLGWFEDKPVNIEELMKRKNKTMIKISENPEIAGIFSKFMQKKTPIFDKK